MKWHVVLAEASGVEWLKPVNAPSAEDAARIVAESAAAVGVFTVKRVQPAPSRPRRQVFRDVPAFVPGKGGWS